MELRLSFVSLLLWGIFLIPKNGQGYCIFYYPFNNTTELLVKKCVNSWTWDKKSIWFFPLKYLYRHTVEFLGICHYFLFILLIPCCLAWSWYSESIMMAWSSEWSEYSMSIFLCLFITTVKTMISWFKESVLVWRKKKNAVCYPWGWF